MRNGTFPARILYEAQSRNAEVVRASEFVSTHHSAQSVSRALRRLAKENKVEAIGHGLYRLLPNKQPTLAFNRAWSNPNANMPPDKVIAVTLARPTLRDVARICKAYGVCRVREILNTLVEMSDISESLAADWRHRLDNIERGFRDAAARLSAR